MRVRLCGEISSLLLTTHQNHAKSRHKFGKRTYILSSLDNLFTKYSIEKYTISCIEQFTKKLSSKNRFLYKNVTFIHLLSFYLFRIKQDLLLSPSATTTGYVSGGVDDPLHGPVHNNEGDWRKVKWNSTIEIFRLNFVKPRGQLMVVV